MRRMGDKPQVRRVAMAEKKLAGKTRQKRRYVRGHGKWLEVARKALRRSCWRGKLVLNETARSRHFSAANMSGTFLGTVTNLDSAQKR